jgi:hypothetical protein
LQRKNSQLQRNAWLLFAATGETLCSIKFATRVRSGELGVAAKNRHSSASRFCCRSQALLSDDEEQGALGTLVWCIIVYLL